MTRIDMHDTEISSIMKMSEGNPGAMSICTRLLREGGEIDTDDIFGGLGSILMLDTLGVYGSEIWMLYKDVCGEDLGKMLAVIRANQLDEVSDDIVKHAIQNRGNGLDVNACVEFVKGRLPGFNI